VAAAETDTTKPGQPGPGKPEKDAAWPLAAVVGFVAMVHVFWWLLGDTVVTYGNLVDSDGYARLVRVERLLETGAWFNSSLPRANWPYGGELHWSRLFDMLLIALALPLMPALGVKAALYWSGAGPPRAGNGRARVKKNFPHPPKCLLNGISLCRPGLYRILKLSGPPGTAPVNTMAP